MIVKRKLVYALLINALLLAGLSGIGILTGQAHVPTRVAASTLPPRPTPLPAGQPDSLSIQELGITLEAYPREARVGDEVQFIIHLSNPWDQKASNVSVLGLIPEAFDVVNVSTTQGTIRFNPVAHRTKALIQPLPANTSVTITITAKVNAQAVAGEKYYAAARLSYGRPDPRRVFSNWVPVTIIGE